MGLFRLLLAMVIVRQHFGKSFLYYPIGGGVALECFFIISGFYMSLVLNEKYVSHKISFSELYTFYSNRLLRILPVYWIFLLLKIIVSVVSLQLNCCLHQTRTLVFFQNHFDSLTTTSAIALIFSNVMVFGLDLFCTVLNIGADGGLFLSAEPTPMSACRFVFIPPAWALSTIFYFYLIVPFLFRKNIVWILSIIGASFLARILTFRLIQSSLLEKEVFPFELALFLLGIVSYRIYIAVAAQRDRYLFLGKVALATVIAVTLGYPLLPSTQTFPYFFSDAAIIYFALVMLGIPFIFLVSQKSKIDRFLGELAFPLYICHYMVILFFGYPMAAKSPAVVAIIFFISLMLSAASVILVVQPINRWRQIRLQAKRGKR